MTYTGLAKAIFDGLSASATAKGCLTVGSIERLAATVVAEMPELQQPVFEQALVEIRGNYPNLNFLTAWEAIQ